MSEYWAVKLAGGSWLAEEGTRRRFKGERRKCTRREALRLAAEFEMESKVVHVTRKKPKAPPKFERDEPIVVRGKFCNATASDYATVWIHGYAIDIPLRHIERAKP